MKTIFAYLRFVLVLPCLALWVLSVWGMKFIYPEFLGSVLREALEEYQHAQSR